MMMHPAAVKTVKEVVNELMGGRGAGRPEKIAEWVTLKI
jgi:CO dehydrogenase/acetyl-CoA synthase delta subunit